MDDPVLKYLLAAADELRFELRDQFPRIDGGEDTEFEEEPSIEVLLHDLEKYKDNSALASLLIGAIMLRNTQLHISFGEEEEEEETV